MPKCRPSLDNGSNRTPTGLWMPKSRRKPVESGKASAKYWGGQHDAAPLGVDTSREAFYHHAALLRDNRLLRSGNGIQRAMTVRRLQRDYGTRYVQRLIEHISRRGPTRFLAKSTNNPPCDKKVPKAAGGPK